MLCDNIINFVKEICKDDMSLDSLKYVFGGIIRSYIDLNANEIINIHNVDDFSKIQILRDMVEKLDIVICDDGAVEIYGDARDIDYIKNNCPKLFYEIKKLQDTYFDTFNYLLDKEEYILC